MLELGMALMIDPDLLLLNEPSLGLAPAIRSKMFDIIVDLKEKQDLSILAIEQNIRELLEVTDWAYVLEQGSVRMSGTGEEILNLVRRRIIRTRERDRRNHRDADARGRGLDDNAGIQRRRGAPRLRVDVEAGGWRRPAVSLHPGSPARRLAPDRDRHPRYRPSG